MPPPPPKPPKPGKVQVFRALFKYDAQGPDEVSLEEGDIIYVSEQHESGWWRATVNGKSGLIPGNYVEPSSAESLEAPLHEAAKRGNLPFLQECVKNNVSVNGLDKAGSTPLHWAARGGHVECVQALLGVPKVQVNVQNKLGDTALHLAAYRGHPDIIKLLLEAGADRTVANGEGKIAYALATDPAAATLLRDRRASQFMAQDYLAPADAEGEDSD